MSKFKIFLILFLPLFFCGCAAAGAAAGAFVDSIFGINQATGEVDPNAPIKTVGTLTSIFYPAATGALGFLTTLLVDIRRKQWKKATTASVDAIASVVRKHSTDGKISVADVLKILNEKQLETGTHGKIQSVRTKLAKQTSL